jgi:hypothetical protein
MLPQSQPFEVPAVDKHRVSAKQAGTKRRIATFPRGDTRKGASLGPVRVLKKGKKIWRFLFWTSKKAFDAML